MANTKISQLPLYSGTAADLRWFVMNNSGETETFKFSGYTSPYKPATEPNSVISSYSTTQPLYPYTQVLGGSGNTFTSSSNTFVSMNDFDVVWAPVNNYNAGLSGISFGNKNSSLAGGINIANYSITNTSNSDAGTYIDNVNGTIYAPGHAVVIGNNLPNLNVNGGVFLGVYQPVAPSGAIRTTMIGGYSNTKNNDGDINTIFNSSQSTIGGTTNWCSIYNTDSSSITGGGSYNSIFNGARHTITSSNYSTIIGGSGNTISSKTNAFMLGTSGRTASADNTTYVENIHTFRTPSTEVQPVLSGTVFTCNLDNGAKSQFYITGTSTINITNVRDGASFMIKTQTDGNYNMTWTATGGYTFVFEGGIKDPGNNVTDIFVFEVFGSVIYGNRRHNYS
jgi:hypothetical protein